MRALIRRALPAAVSAFKDPHRHVQAEALNVAPQWVGAPLATPVRRAWALGLDLLVVALLSGVGGLWLVAGLALVVLQLRNRRDLSDSELPATPGRIRRRAWLGWAAAALLLFLAAGEAQDRWSHWRSNGSQGDTAAAIAKDTDADQAQALAEAARALKEAQAEVPALAGVAQQVEAMARAASTASAPGGTASLAVAAASAASAPSPDQLRIAQLEAQLKEARRLKPLSWREQWQRLWDDVAAGLGWGIVYFSLLPAWWGGQTVGKKLFGLRVVELTGKPMTVMRSLKRYGGYAAGMATGGLGFAQVLWDVNRQALQDKSAHTVVIDVRQPWPVPEAVPPESGGTPA